MTGIRAKVDGQKRLSQWIQNIKNSINDEDENLLNQKLKGLFDLNEGDIIEIEELDKDDKGYWIMTTDDILNEVLEIKSEEMKKSY